MAIALDRMEKEGGIGTADGRGTVGHDETAGERRPGLPFTFTGNAGEYFGIWIVNILLSVVTLGIYSAWAKVRNKRYFYGNTKLDGSSFAYLASPVQILKGRVLAFALFAIYAVCSAFLPVVAIIFGLLFIVLTPWAIVRARAFNAYNSSYRNVRFGFDGGTAEAARIYILWPVLTVFTLGLLWPYVAYRMDRFLPAHARYGRTPLAFEGRPGPYYRFYIITALLSAVAVALYFPAFASGVTSAGLDPQNVDLSIFLEFGALNYLLIGLAVLLGLASYTYLTVTRQNYVISNTRIGDHELKLDLEMPRFLWIRISNLVVIALSVGLMIPWARIRMARYQIERMSLVTHGDLDTLVNHQREKAGAYGDEIGEGMDLDLGIGV